jgi:uncharacterized protein (TIGR00730 family)
MRRVCVFCGSSSGSSPDYSVAARHCGAILAARKLTLVYGGGNIGLMGVLADATLAAGGEVIGVIPRKLIEREVAHDGLTTLIPVDSMHERKHKMAELADAFLALPGGVGTLEEFFEVLSWLQLGLHTKPVGLLNVLNFYDPMLTFLEHMRDERFLKAEYYESLLVGEDVEPLLDRLAVFVPPPVEKWIRPSAANLRPPAPPKRRNPFF